MMPEEGKLYRYALGLTSTDAPEITPEMREQIEELRRKWDEAMADSFEKAMAELDSHTFPLRGDRVRPFPQLLPLKMRPLPEGDNSFYGKLLFGNPVASLSEETKEWARERGLHSVLDALGEGDE